MHSLSRLPVRAKVVVVVVVAAVAPEMEVALVVQLIIFTISSMQWTHKFNSNDTL
jgi:hypothetical protein